MVGQVIGNHQVLREIARGGMSTVYEAAHQQTGRRSVVKVLTAALCHDPQIVQRFFNEARAASAVNHPGIVHIFESGQLPDGAAYLIMEYIDGEALGTRLRQHGRLPVAEVLNLAEQIALVLSATHDKGIIHRDLKPDNVMILRNTRQGRGEKIKVLDFGVAKLLPEQQAESEAPVHTKTGTIMGTPEFMAPEQIYHSARVDAKADVYSLGVMLYVMLSGQLPFVGEWTNVIMMHLHSAPPPLQSLVPDLPTELVRLVHAMLGKIPAERPAMPQVAAALAMLRRRAQLTGFALGPGRYVLALLITVLTATLVVLCFRPAAEDEVEATPGPGVVDLAPADQAQHAR